MFRKRDNGINEIYTETQGVLYSEMTLPSFQEKGKGNLPFLGQKFQQIAYFSTRNVDNTVLVLQISNKREISLLSAIHSGVVL